MTLTLHHDPSHLMARTLNSESHTRRVSITLIPHKPIKKPYNSTMARNFPFEELPLELLSIVLRSFPDIEDFLRATRVAHRWRVEGSRLFGRDLWAQYELNATIHVICKRVRDLRELVGYLHHVVY